MLLFFVLEVQKVPDHRKERFMNSILGFIANLRRGLQGSTW